MEAKEEYKTKEEHERERRQRLHQLQRDLNTLVTNTQIAMDARVVLQRKQQAKAQENREVLLEKDSTSSQKTLDEILRRYYEDIMNETGIPEDLQKAYKKNQQLFATIIQDKKKLINELQQEVKLQDDDCVSNLRRNAEEINLMIARMDDQVKLTTKAYREELAQIETLNQQEASIFLTKDTEGLEQYLKTFWDKELERLTERKEILEKYSKEFHQISQESNHIFIALDYEKRSRTLAQEREKKRVEFRNFQLNVRKKLYEEIEIERKKMLSDSLANIKSRIHRESREIEKLKKIYIDEQKECSKQISMSLKDYKRCIQKYEQTKKQVTHFAVADAKRFEEVWLMTEAEVKQLAQRALTVDSMISQWLFGLPWRQPDPSLLELSSPIRLWKPAVQTRNSRQGMLDGSAESDVETPDITMSTEGTAVSMDSRPEWEEGKQSKDMQKEMTELLCNETDFLMEAKVLKLLAPLVTEEQTDVKLGSLLYTLGIDENDLPQLTDFLLNYKQQQLQQTEDACNTSVASSASELILPNYVLPALRSFLEQRNARQSSAQQLSRLWLAHARDSSKDAAYWESLGNIIPEEKVKLWDAAERTQEQYHAVVTEISDLIPETECLRQQNTELRLKLNSRLKK